MTRAGFPHSDILGSRFVCQLPEAFRRLPRPSSAPSAKASTLCPYKLDHKDFKDARVHCAVLKQRPGPPCSARRLPPPGAGTPPKERPTPEQKRFNPARTIRRPPPPTTSQQTGTSRELATPKQQPTGCSLRTQQRARPTPHQQPPVPSPRSEDRRRTRAPPADKPAVVDVPPSSTTPHTLGTGMGLDQHDPPMTGEPTSQMLLRKEVIQPHLPVRLPCYDLVPIASPTFDGSPHKGWATGFGCYRLS